VNPLELRGHAGACRVYPGETIKNLTSYIRNGKSAILLADRKVFDLHRAFFPDFPAIPIESAEATKTLETAALLYRKFIEYGVDRNWLVIGIGGGIVCDLAGFVASTFMRGLDFGFVATTLLAQVDAALGGKNGLNVLGYKNMVGTFRQPAFVLCDYDLLRTLPENEVKCGLSEIIKTAAVADESLFSYLEDHLEGCLALERSALEEIVPRTCRIKLDIVAQDETERGLRRKLNFGHTIGHALEKALLISHGEAVGVGMVAAARFSHKKGMLGKEDRDRLIRLIQRTGLLTPEGVTAGSIREAIAQDKKREGRTIHFVFLERIGNAVVESVALGEILEFAELWLDFMEITLR
jgi:3-dehydroquinate synthase